MNLLALSLTFTLTTLGASASPSAEFRDANQTVLQGNVADGITRYEALLRQGTGGADLEYNLGTAYLKTGKLGPGILHLERALRQNPRDSDARANLERAERLRVDRLEGRATELGGERPFASRIASATSRGFSSWSFLLLWVTGWLLLLVARRPKTLRLIAGLLLVAASIPCGAILLAHVAAQGEHEAIILAPTLPVREGASASLPTKFEIHEGLPVRLLEQKAPFAHIRLANGLTGWVDSSGLEEIEP